MITRGLMQQRGGLGPRAQDIIKGVGELTMQQPTGIRTAPMAPPLQAMPIRSAGSGGLVDMEVPVRAPSQAITRQVPASTPEQVASVSKDMLPPMKAASAVAEQEKEQPELLRDPVHQDRVNKLFGGRDRMLRLAMAFNTLRFRPDQGLSKVLGDELKYIRGKEQQNKTLAYLDQVNPQLAKLVRGGMPVKDAIALLQGGKAVSAEGKLRADFEAGRITKEEFNAGMNRLAMSGKQFAAPPAGYEYDFTDKGVRLVPIEGGPAEKEIEAEAARKGDVAAGAVQSGLNVLSAIDQLDAYLAEDRLIPLTGLGGDLRRLIKNPDRMDSEGFRDTIQSNIGFNALNRMRAQSPTGGALGNVTERELALLQSTIASINLDQDEETVRANLAQIRDQYVNIMRKAAAYPDFEKFFPDFDVSMLEKKTEPDQPSSGQPSSGIKIRSVRPAGT